MQPALRMETTILPGHRLEISAPELPEGARVEVIVVLPEKPEPCRISMLEFLESLPPGPRSESRCPPTMRYGLLSSKCGGVPMMFVDVPPFGSGNVCAFTFMPIFSAFFVSE